MDVFLFYACGSPCDQQWGHIKVAKNPQTSRKESQQFCQVMGPTTLWVHDYCIQVLIEVHSKKKLVTFENNFPMLYCMPNLEVI
jgi:hypothetical protein